MKDRLANFGFWLAWTILWRLPESVARSLFNLVAYSMWRMNARGVRQLSFNLARVCGDAMSVDELRKLTLQGMRSYMRYYCETFLVNRWSREKINRTVEVENVDIVLEALQSGGIILALPHSGNWDLAGAWATKALGQISTVAERLRPESVFQKFLKMRTNLGIDVVALTGSTGVYEFLRDAVNKGNVVPILSDRDVAKNGMSNDFFGYKTSLPIGAAMLAVDTGRPVVVCSTWYEKDKLKIRFDNPIYAELNGQTGRERIKLAQQMTGQIAQLLETHIKAHPQDWHVLQPVWKDLVA